LTNVMYAGTLVYNKTTRKLKTPTRKNPVDLWVKTAGAFVGLVDPSLFDRAQGILAQAAQRYSPGVMLQHLERLYREHGFLRASILRADGEAPSPSTSASHSASLDASYQQAFRSTVDAVGAEVEPGLGRKVGPEESHEVLGVST